MFTARNRQNPFAKRRRAEREATAVPYDSRTDDSGVITDTPDLSTLEAETPSAPVEINAETRANVDAVLNSKIKANAPETHSELSEAETMHPGSSATSAEPKRGRGRPRPQETIDRDNRVYALLAGADPSDGISKESIAAELGEKEQQVYSSLRQLTKEGRAETRYLKGHGYRWFALSPAETQ